MMKCFMIFVFFMAPITLSFNLDYMCGLFGNLSNNIHSKPDSVGVEHVNNGLNPSKENVRVEWQRSYPRFEIDDYLVDDNGKIWIIQNYFRPSGAKYNSCIIRRLDHNGNELLAFRVNNISHILPVASINNSLIICDIFDMHLSNTLRRIFRIDSDGQVIWEIRNVDSSSKYIKPWVISNDRLMIDAGKGNDGEFYIYSMEDGKRVKSLQFPYWDESSNGIKPIELADGGWISYDSVSHKNRINQPGVSFVRLSSDMEPEWHSFLSLNTVIEKQPLIIDDRILVAGIPDGLYGIDVENGSTMWVITDYAHPTPLGTTKNNKLIFSAQGRSLRSAERYVFDRTQEFSFSSRNSLVVADSKSGNVLSEFYDPVRNPDKNSFLSFDDGSILYGGTYGLAFADDSGNILWTMDERDFSFERKGHRFLGWNLNKTQNGKIIVATSYSVNIHNDMLCLSAL